MTPTLPTEQIDRIVWNQHHDPFTVLGPHEIEQDGKSVWVVRAYLPDAEAVSVVTPDQNKEYSMQSVHHPHFFECVISDAPHLFSYQLKVKSSQGDRLMRDPYYFKSPLLTEFDAYLFGEGTHYQIYEKMGAHPTEIDGVSGVYFAVWAPNARNVSVIGDFNSWDGRKHQMRKGHTGIWDLFIPDLTIGTVYKYEIKSPEGHIYEKSDPYGFFQEIRPKTASIVTDLNDYQWHDQDWLDNRRSQDPLKQPISVYELHLGSWMHSAMDHPPESGYPAVAAADLKPGARFLTYRELAEDLIPYVKGMGYTHIEVMPIAEHPFDGSWGYQVTGYYAATSRYGTPQDLMYFIDKCHQNNIGIIVDWVPAHFPKDGHGLSFFDGTFLYEPADVRIGEHKEWGTKIFNYKRSEVKNFLIANVLFWFEKYHIDGIRVDAVASMIYRDYNREAGTWLPNEYGGRESLEAIELFRHLHSILFTYYPGALSIAEESTSWPMVTWPAYSGGLGFNLKWNMGWMHDMLNYFKLDPYFRGHNNNYLTFSIWYAFSENFMLALSHDEVVHGKSPMIGKMPGDEWQKFANLRCLYGYMFTHPGKKTMFMGMEIGQWSEWNVWGDLEWHLLQYQPHKSLQTYIGDLNKLLRSTPELYVQDFSQDGFEWIECNDTQNSVISFLRKAEHGDFVLVVCNFTPVPHHNYRVGVPEKGFYKEILNSDAPIYGGSGIGNLGGKYTDDYGTHGKPYSLDVTAPPLSVVVLKYIGEDIGEA
ncbi:1,4-alpha-glucan branching protein GlgB [Pseudanabaena sp. FACHB-1277]|jgi:1,4-alpha-glucan branching enzyme|uniref:1,4-alpha-glucan branching enzyme GlgB n=1 Tax=Pseudanabaena cinerea FACHB-1277 TaxID=2949581 RepID=A0A926Z722_9CYAN|nr:1,4-alpha-glucan branching protein GlgB [Pseudanabaena cinerea]MBD2151383.1 1,4-alpha-glucan branching protein GlgB [Pseudanabaena cinerea FACHB-1277]